MWNPPLKRISLQDKIWPPAFALRLTLGRRNLSVSAQEIVEAHQIPISMNIAIQHSFITTLTEIHSQNLVP
jgi:hypothetical protein